MTPLTNYLHTNLRGDWEDCYRQMHVHAVKMEMLTDEKQREIESLTKQLKDMKELLVTALNR